MADFSYADDLELQKLNTAVLEEPEEFENWEKLIRAAESQEGGLNRNSSPQAIAATRQTYDSFLAKFPLFFGYWKKYADLEFSIAGTEAAEMVYERGVASVGTSVDLWANYCTFKVETSHDADVIRELYERAATSVGLDFLSHPFWDKYLEFEERLEAQDRIFAILDRLIHIPMHQYARYFERYRNLTQTQPITSLAPADIVAQFRAECVREAGPKGKNDLEMERDLRAKIDAFNMEVFHRTANETNKRWTYESEIKRPYFHVTELDETQIVNWRKYLDFEEVEGEYVRTQFLYERCMVTCAYYDEFWFRYARWMSSQKDKTEEVRNIYQRASCVYVPISRPSIRLHYAYFEESCDKVDIAIAIHEAILMNIPGHVETIISLANIHRRQRGFEAMVEIFKNYIDSAECSHETKGAILAEWAKATWVVSGDVDEARKIYQSHQPWYLGSRHFWIGFLSFELELPTSRKQETERHTRIKAVHDDMRQKSHLPVHIMKDLSSRYLMYLQERGGKEAIKEFVQLDMEIKGPFSIQTGMKSKLADDGSEATTQRRMVMENGHPGVEVNEAVIRAGGNPYTKYYQQQGEQPVNGQAPPARFPA